MNTQKFHNYGIGFYADDEQAVARVTACVQQVAAELQEDTYVIREKAPAQDGKARVGGTFGVALQGMKCGKGATRPGLGGVLRLRQGEESQEAIFVISQGPGMRTWAPTYADLLAEDWEVVD